MKYIVLVSEARMHLRESSNAYIRPIHEWHAESPRPRTFSGGNTSEGNRRHQAYTAVPIRTIVPSNQHNQYDKPSQTLALDEDLSGGFIMKSFSKLQ